MGRPSSIKEADVLNAVDFLQESRRPINPYQVRQVLGRGSTAKIAHFLESLDIQSTYEDSEFQPAIELNEERSQYLAKLVRPLVFQLEEDQEAAIGKAEAQFEKQREELEALVSTLESKLAGKQSELDTLETRSVSAESKIEKLEEENAQLKIDAAANQEKQNALQEKIHSLNEEVRGRKEQIEHAHSEKAELLRRHDLQLAQLREDFDTLKNESLDYRNKAEKQFAEDSAEKTRLQEQINTQQSASDRATAERQRLEKELSDSQYNETKLRESLSKQDVNVETLEKHLEDAESEKARLEETHNELKTIFANTKQSNQALETANQGLVAEVEFLKEILRKFEGLRKVGDSEDSTPTNKRDNPKGS